MQNRRWLAAVTLTLAMFAAPLPTLADSHMDHSWSIKVDGKSESSGTISLKMTSAPDEDGSQSDPLDVEIMVPDKAKRKDVQTTIENNFRAALGDELYKIRTHGSNEVSIKAKSKTPWFSLELTNNTVQGISVALEH